MGGESDKKHEGKVQVIIIPLLGLGYGIGVVHAGVMDDSLCFLHTDWRVSQAWRCALHATSPFPSGLS